jgi:hypothetical protein
MEFCLRSGCSAPKARRFAMKIVLFSLRVAAVGAQCAPFIVR